MIRRNRLQMNIDVLNAIYRGKHSPTPIMMSSNLMWVKVLERLTDLEEKGLITKETQGKRRYYYLTNKGKHVLEQYKKIQVNLPT